MKSEHQSHAKTMLWLPVIAAVIVVLLLGFSARSLVLLFVEPRPADVVKPESAAAVEMQDAELKMQIEGVESGKHGTETSEPETRVETAAQGRPRQQTTELDRDFQALRERETARQDTIATLREIAAENPESCYAMTEEQIRKFEQSGASFQ